MTQRDLAIQIVPFQEPMTEECERLLAALPEWFGIPASNEAYIRSLSRLTSWVALRQGEVIGFVAVERHFPESAENHVLAVRPDHHRQGVGRALIETAEQWLLGEGVEFFLTKTLAPSDPYVPYRATRAFYTALGFRPLFETTAFWGEEDPALVMVKLLHPWRRAAGDSGSSGAGS